MGVDDFSVLDMNSQQLVAGNAAGIGAAQVQMLCCDGIQGEV